LRSQGVAPSVLSRLFASRVPFRAGVMWPRNGTSRAVRGKIRASNRDRLRRAQKFFLQRYEANCEVQYAEKDGPARRAVIGLSSP
jgi:hypothetical protein